jgi:nitroimidazol reductase NimA-like FMN-containing flavoprotein (pyridoxamine 5'-phosphate oxidase superfamily)
MSSPPWLDPEELSNVTTLTEEQCWSALSSERYGRLAVTAEDGVDIFPVNFMVHDHALFFRSAPGTKLADIARSPTVAFEADGVSLLTHWSVVVRGQAHRLSDQSEILEAGVESLSTMTSSRKWNYIRITPRMITGVSFSRS